MHFLVSLFVWGSIFDAFTKDHSRSSRHAASSGGRHVRMSWFGNPVAPRRRHRSIFSTRPKRDETKAELKKLKRAIERLSE
jgi:hypothetical protein